MITERHGKDRMEKVLNKGDKDGQTSLFVAAWQGYLQVVQYLVNIKETDVNMTGDDGKSPLHVASQFGHLEIVKACLLFFTCIAGCHFENNMYNFRRFCPKEKIWI